MGQQLLYFQLTENAVFGLMTKSFSIKTSSRMVNQTTFVEQLLAVKTVSFRRRRDSAANISIGDNPLENALTPKIQGVLPMMTW
jgi:hypothetical protein